MRKLKLDLEQLSVESFAASSAPQAGPGTVEAHNTAYEGTCNTYTCRCPTEYRCTGWEGGTMDECTYAPTMNPALFECYSLAYCIATKPCP